MFVFALSVNEFRRRRKLIYFFIASLIVIMFYFFETKQEIINYDIYFLGQNMRGYSPQQIEELLIARFVEWQQEPVNAIYNQERQAVVPELWGYRVNIEETLQEIIQASPGDTVFPVMDTLFPEIVMDDYPAAFVERGNPNKNEVALMINVAWGTEYLHPMLDVLNKANARGTFFVVGRWAQEHGPLLQEIVSCGHQLANHGHTDAVAYTRLTPEEIMNGLKEVNLLIENTTGVVPKYFTPHRGEYNQLLLEVVSRMEMRTVLWTIDTVDWQKPGVENMKNKVLNNINGGSIILMHPTADTVVFLQETIPLIQQKGYAVVTLSELLSPHYPSYVLNLGDIS